MNLPLPSRPRTRLALAAAVVAALALLYVLASCYIVNQAVVVEVHPLEESPDGYGLVYEDVEFSPRGWPGITLRGWWLPAEDAKGTVIRVHGIDSNRETQFGITKALVEGGYSVLVFDLRGHGESDTAQTGAGQFEQDDVLGALDYVLDERGTEPGRALLHGTSLGAGVALLAGVDEPAVSGVFADSPFTSLGDMLIREVTRRSSLPEWAGPLLRPGIETMARAAKGIDINSVRPIDVVGEYDYPLGLAHCRSDDRIPIRQMARIRAAVEHPPRMTIYENCPHADGWDEYPDHYEAFMLDYFDERLGL